MAFDNVCLILNICGCVYKIKLFKQHKRCSWQNYRAKLLKMDALVYIKHRYFVDVLPLTLILLPFLSVSSKQIVDKSNIL